MFFTTDLDSKILSLPSLTWRPMGELLIVIFVRVDGNTIVRDHCHLTGVNGGAAYESCNLNYKVPKFLPMIFHNMVGYDAHLFIKNRLA